MNTMNFLFLLDGTGLAGGDWCVAFLATTAAISQWYRVSIMRIERRGLRFWRCAFALGFSLMSIRLVVSLAVGIDPIISPVSIVALSLICGSVTMIELLSDPNRSFFRT